MRPAEEEAYLHFSEARDHLTRALSELFRAVLSRRYRSEALHNALAATVGAAAEINALLPRRQRIPAAEVARAFEYRSGTAPTAKADAL